MSHDEKVKLSPSEILRGVIEEQVEKRERRAAALGAPPLPDLSLKSSRAIAPCEPLWACEQLELDPANALAIEEENALVEFACMHGCNGTFTLELLREYQGRPDAAGELDLELEKCEDCGLVYAPVTALHDGECPECNAGDRQCQVLEARDRRDELAERVLRLERDLLGQSVVSQTEGARPQVVADGEVLP